VAQKFNALLLLSSLHGLEIYETNCFKLEIFTEPLCWVAVAASSRVLETLIPLNENSSAKDAQTVEHLESLFQTLPTYCNCLPSSGRSAYPYPAPESCFLIHYCTHLVVAASSSTQQNRSRTNLQLQHHRNTFQSLLQAQYATPANNDICLYGITLSS
jgi:hypothetical protein